MFQQSTYLVAINLLSWSLAVAPVNGVNTIEYYIGAVEVKWDFAPSGKDLVSGNSEQANVFIARTNSTIGSEYKKAVFRRYTDGTFTQRTPHPDWMGILGPVISGEVGDTLRVTFRNLASRPYSMHPHGVRYDKRSEGAMYKDRTSGADKADDGVAPGSTYVYTWNVTSQFGPTNDDPACVAWVYHSHVNPAKDTNTGLIGPLVTCKKGSIDDAAARLDGSSDRYLMFKIFEEGLSWYMSDNIARCLNPSLCSQLHASKDGDFEESNLMHSINGYVYGNLPPVEVCLGDRVNWHLIGLGAHLDMHTVTIHGQTLTYHNHRVESLGLFPADLKTASMRVEGAVGLSDIYCQVNDHLSAGMQAFLNVTSCGVPPSPAKPAKSIKRTYFIAAEEVLWNYAPSGVDAHTGERLNISDSASSTFFLASDTRIGGTYQKARYIEYTDATFTQRAKVASHHEHLGIMGPLIRVEVGDTIRIVFKNLATKNFSIAPNSLQMSKPNYSMHSGAASNQTQTFTWSVPSNVGPTPADEQCLPSFYFSPINSIRDTSSGLYGPILICRSGSVDANGYLKNGDNEFFLTSTITDENLSAYIDDNIARLIKPGDVQNDPDFEASNKMTNINGFMYGNLPGLKTCLNDRVVWYMLGLGTETDVHSLHFYGNTFQRSHNRGHTVSVFPGISRTLTMVPDHPGEWAIVCYTNDHLTNGLTANYRVKTCGTDAHKQSKVTGRTRSFYVAAVEIDWDYAPNKDALGKMPPSNPKSMGYIFVRNDTGYIGSVYKKAVYKEYTDSTFLHEKQDGGGSHLGLVGPTLHVEVGDQVEIIFKNMASRPFSLHTQGLSYDSENSGSKFQIANSGVAPGGFFIYRWYVPERSGPASDDSNCIPWPYISAVDPVRDTSSGLFGTIVVCRKGILAAKGNKRTDGIDREFVLYFHVIDENHSWYIKQNIEKYAPTRVDDEDFLESNRYYSINGGIFGNTRGLTMYKNERVAWYIIGLGNEIDIHTVHFHGQTVLARTSGLHTLDVISVFPGTTETVVMVADNPGLWLLHCHLNHHLMNGMTTTYDVKHKAKTGVTTTMRDGGKSAQHDGESYTGLIRQEVIVIATVCVSTFLLVVVIGVGLLCLRRAMLSRNGKPDIY